MGEDDLLQVFEKDEEWLLVRLDSGGKLGYVPGTYVQEEAGSAGDTGFAAGAAATSEVRVGERVDVGPTVCLSFTHHQTAGAREPPDIPRSFGAKCRSGRKQPAGQEG